MNTTIKTVVVYYIRTRGSPMAYTPSALRENCTSKNLNVKINYSGGYQTVELSTRLTQRVEK